MCGIIGVVALPGYTPLPPAEMVYRGLLRLEYRGYDSAGIASIDPVSRSILVLKGAGRIAALERRLGFSRAPGYTVVGHTRWATHGRPNDANAHPHTDCRGTIAIVHNGIIQNYLELKKWLIDRGHVFSSETDTEVFAHLVEELYKSTRSFYEAFKKAVEMIKGSYALAVITIHEPDKIFFARKDSPLVIGIGEKYNLVASDIPALLEYTNKVIIVHDNEVGYITPETIHLEHLGKGVIDYRKRIRVVEWSIEDASKSGYPHFMLKEIHEQPRAVRDTIYGIEGDPMVEEAVSLLTKADNVFITAAGTSFYASLYYSLLTSILAGKPVIPFIASEYSVYAGSAGENDVLIVVSQSGETIDSLMALRAFKKEGVKVIAVSNVVDSAIPRESDIVLYTRAGPEIGVAATKTFTTQTILLSWLAVKHGVKEKVLDRDEGDVLLEEIKKAPDLVSKSIAWNEEKAKRLSRWFARKTNAYYLSRGIGVPVALEGALKMKEIAYVHAEGYPAGESKHGPIALVEEDYPVVFVVPRDKELARLLHGNVQEMKARGATTIAVAPESLQLDHESIDYVFKVPDGHWVLTPATHIPPLQLLAYYTAVERGYDPDRPRNLAKTVTVE
ncbi:glutamine--fructose-6-phosphate transaminase (isomerizing) [Desulfurococcaceae archaeon MEX13E-LK6-19]|nr:glutamine--fructose-6-phosphate transaminase (isomerizing) [Desulfurococcaceae archaeon MEX13E-LK6-19]